MSAQNMAEQEMDCELLNQGEDNFVSSCNHCKNYVETRFHCTVCDDFDLCTVCKEKVGHEHAMEKLGLDLDEESPNDLKQTNPQEARKQSIQRCIQSLIHACRCQEQQCRQPSCMKMKRVVAHTKICKRKTNGGCPICKQLFAVCCYHGTNCSEVKCLVPFCPNIKHKLKQQQLAQRIQQASQQQIPQQQMMNMRAGMQGMGQQAQNQNPNTADGNVQGNMPQMMSPQQHPQQPPTQQQQPPMLGQMGGPRMQSMENMQSMQQMGPMPGNAGNQMQGQGQNTTQQQQWLLKNQMIMQRQQQQQQMQMQDNYPPPYSQQRMRMPFQQGSGNIGNDQQQFGMNRMQHNQQGVMGPPTSQSMSMQQQLMQTVRYPPLSNSQLMRPNPQMQQQFQQQKPQQKIAQNAQNIGNQGHKQALQQLMMTLKNPNSTNPDQQQQILNILKSNPQLMSTFIKHRQAQNQNQNAPGGNVQGNMPHMMNKQQSPQQGMNVVASMSTQTVPTLPPPSSSSISDSSTNALKWHESISDEYRKHMARMYSQTINPDENENIGEIVEDEIYKKADSKHQYCQLMVDKIYNVRKEMEMSKNQNGTTSTTAIPPEQSEIQPDQQQQIQTNSQESNTTFDASDRLISYVEDMETNNQPNESNQQVEVMDITDLLSESDQQDSWVVVKSEAPDAITSDQIISHRKNCNDFNCPACLPLNLAIRELKTSKQNIDNILSLLEMECDDSD